MGFPLHSPRSFLTKAYAGEQKDVAVQQHGWWGWGQYWL
jgi:hypothetical protein